MRSLRSILIPLLALALLGLAAPAFGSGRDVVKDCAEDGVIDGDYSQKELEDAEDELPSDIDEYTDCREAIRGELTPGGGGGNRPKSGDPALTTDSGAIAGSPEDIQALDAIAEASGNDDAPTLDVGGERVTPGDPSGGKLLGLGGTSNDLPTSLASTLILLLAAAAGGLYLLLRRRLAAGVGPTLRNARGSLARLLRRG